MRIENNGRIAGIATRKAARGSNGGPAFMVDERDAAPLVAAANAVLSTSPIDALLALQAAADPRAGRKKQVRRARSLLDVLETLNVDLLAGRFSDGHLNQVMALIGQAREPTEPLLDALIDDIELRARVELAKRGLFPAL